jgi:hypothetical protein
MVNDSCDGFKSTDINLFGSIPMKFNVTANPAMYWFITKCHSKGFKFPRGKMFKKLSRTIKYG